MDASILSLIRGFFQSEKLSTLCPLAEYNLKNPHFDKGYRIIRWVLNDAVALAVAAGYRPFGINGNCALPHYANFDALLKKGVDVTATNEMGDSALEIILNVGNIKEHMPFVDRLIEAGANLSLERFYFLINREYSRRRAAILSGMPRKDYNPNDVLVKINQQFELNGESYNNIGSKLIRAFCEKYSDKIIS